MEFMDAIKKRRSIRKFKTESVSNKMIMEIEAGAFIDTPLDGEGFATAMKNRAVMSDADAAYPKFNAAIAIDHMTLRATNEILLKTV
ncbi:MAG: hypothetical protein CVV44_10445 [Spirochaetae bacterium HGW-Spirochaetae-1]|jgi:acyl CoA:acetate/3-ketoacid CoA transferase|nr:MAG: hypothetical protein CVV44_10445 [Spirochaetae bacterium HGW-Spirochaetae-1]